jgi:hypothetical protein
MEKNVFEWQARAYPSYQKSKAWYAFMMFLILMLVLYDLWTGGWIMSLTFLLLAGVYYFFELKPSPMFFVVVNDEGITFGKKPYLYQDLESFWMLQVEGLRSLVLKLRKGVPREVSIPIPLEMDLPKLRSYLLLHLTEETGKKEAFTDQVIRHFGL